MDSNYQKRLAEILTFWEEVAVGDRITDRSKCLTDVKELIAMVNDRDGAVDGLNAALTAMSDELTAERNAHQCLVDQLECVKAAEEDLKPQEWLQPELLDDDIDENSQPVKVPRDVWFA